MSVAGLGGSWEVFAPTSLHPCKVFAMMDAGGATRQPTTKGRQLMNYLTYEDSVLDHADEAGNLSSGDAVKLLSDHGFTLSDLYADNHGVSWSHLGDRNAEALLAWLGY